MNTLDKVKEFHEKFKSTINNTPTIDNEGLNHLRIKLLQEELNELVDGLRSRNPIEVLDALTDLQYVLDGAYIALGFHPYKEEAFNEVHRSNMTKLDENGDPIFRKDGKIMKGPNFEEPDLYSVLYKNDIRKNLLFMLSVNDVPKERRGDLTEEIIRYFDNESLSEIYNDG